MIGFWSEETFQFGVYYLELNAFVGKYEYNVLDQE